VSTTGIYPCSYIFTPLSEKRSPVLGTCIASDPPPIPCFLFVFRPSLLPSFPSRRSPPPVSSPVRCTPPDGVTTDSSRSTQVAAGESVSSIRAVEFLNPHSTAPGCYLYAYQIMPRLVENQTKYIIAPRVRSTFWGNKKNTRGHLLSGPLRSRTSSIL